MLKSGEAWTQNDVEMNGATDFNYSLMFFQLAESGKPAVEFASFVEYDAWLKTTKRFGSISVVRAEFLKTTSIEAITKCEDNTEIGKSSDVKYVFYLGNR